MGDVCLLLAALGVGGSSDPASRALAISVPILIPSICGHLPVVLWFVPLMNRMMGWQNWFLDTTVYIFGSLLLGVSMAVATEFPVLRLRDRWFPSRGRPLTLAPADVANLPANG